MLHVAAFLLAGGSDAFINVASALVVRCCRIYAFFTNVSDRTKSCFVLGYVSAREGACWDFGAVMVKNTKSAQLGYWHDLEGCHTAGRPH